MKISNSEIQCYKQCKRRWMLAYYRRLKPNKEKVTGALALGSRVHVCLAQYYTPGPAGGNAGLAMGLMQASAQEDREKIDPLNAELLAAFDKECNLARIMCEGYFEWVAESGVDATLKILEAESEIEAGITVSGEPVIIMGKRDAIGVDTADGVATLVDFKTCQTLNDPMLDLNEQNLMYLMLQRLNGSITVQKSLWRFLRKVQRTAKANPPFYGEETLNVSDLQLRHFWTRLHGEIADLLATRARLDGGEDHRSAAYPTPTRDCSWRCEYRIACPMLDSDPHAEEFILSQYYIGNPYERYQEIEKSGSEES